LFLILGPITFLFKPSTGPNLTHNNIPSINIHPFTKNLNVLDVDNMDTIREDVV
jgi:hypothetical protein